MAPKRHAPGSTFRRCDYCAKSNHEHGVTESELKRNGGKCDACAKRDTSRKPMNVWAVRR